ncbi:MULTISPECIES: hypothetical protein [unclassified Streptomyces]|uniref:hypothetical protein n=1 Tax=unclassified Streptomyces TaxID=2593676 RepID=UPI00278C3502|nr:MULTISPECIES: hypothetical protein [unclassified Streptomyces]
MGGSRSVPTNGLSPVYDEAGAASARFLRWLVERTGTGGASRVASAEFAAHERCTVDLVADVVERLAALGWLTEHNDSGADPPLVSPTAAGLAEVAVWDEAYADREARRRYAKAALFAYWDRAGKHRSGDGSNPEDFLWASEAFYCGRQLPMEDLEYAGAHLELPTPVRVSPAEQGAGVVISYEELAQLVQASRPDLSASDGELRQVVELAGELTDVSRSGGRPDDSAVRGFFERAGNLLQSEGRDMATSLAAELIRQILRLP